MDMFCGQNVARIEYVGSDRLHSEISTILLFPEYDKGELRQIYVNRYQINLIGIYLNLFHAKIST